MTRSSRPRRQGVVYGPIQNGKGYEASSLSGRILGMLIVAGALGALAVAALAFLEGRGDDRAAAVPPTPTAAPASPSDATSPSDAASPSERPSPAAATVPPPTIAPTEAPMASPSPTGIFVGTNLAEDPGFERLGNARTTWSKETGWQISKNNPRSGARGALTLGGSAVHTGISNANWVDVKPGDRLYISGWMGADANANGWGSVRITWYNSNRQLVAQSYLQAIAPYGYWEQSSGFAVAPANAAYARGNFVVHDRTIGTWYADDLLMGVAPAP